VRDAGLHFDEIVADGRFHRGRGPYDAEWLIANVGTTTAGRTWLRLSAGDFRETGGAYSATVVYRSWRRGELSQRELAEVRQQHGKAQKASQLRLTAAQETARKRACTLWHEARSRAHPYLARKRLPSFNTRVRGPALLVPMFTMAGDLVSLQGIRPDGFKANLPGGRAGGVYHPIGFLFRRDQPKVYLAEGWATAAAIHHVRGVPAVATFSAANLTPIAKAIRRDAPGTDIVIAADHDPAGLLHANRAAAACKGRLVVPPREGDDWWDHFAREGLL
jgi:putative DNA primase/helicase